MSLESLYKEKAGLAWKYFEALSQIPRMSKYEDGVREWLLSIAKEEGWESRQDACGNVVLAIPGCGRHADADILILQGHMDMVCEKNADVAHDFHKDPIQLLIDGDWVTAEGTTLGADNGVAIALGLAIAKAALTDRRPLELLFTIDEETGLTGALELDPGILKGRQLLNLDSEEDDTFTIGCAGGLDMQFRFGKVKKSFTDSLTVKISGLRGGHSGINIHEERGHAIKLTGELFKALKDAGEVFELISMTAGNKRNAIPREAEIQLSGSTKARLDKISADLTAAYAEREADLKIAITEGPAADSCIDNRVIDFLIKAPIGVTKMHPEFPDLVQTSNSFGVAAMEADGLFLWAHGRSSSKADTEQLGDRMQALANESGAHYESEGSYPGWQPKSGSNILKEAVAVYKSCFNEAPRVEAIHAGLEAGIIGDIIGSDELLAYGPTIKEAHSPDEKLNIASFEKVYLFLERFVTS